MYGIPESLIDVVTVEMTIGQPIIIKVKDVHWEGQWPVSTDIIFAELPEKATERQITAQVKKLLKSKTYIRQCEHCRQYKIIGWMQSNLCCQSCAEKYFGVVY